jgi:hypothetical protein
MIFGSILIGIFAKGMPDGPTEFEIETRGVVVNEPSGEMKL